MIISFKDAYEDRMLKRAERVKRDRDALDPKDPDYIKKDAVLAKREKDVAEDFRNYSEVLLEERKTEDEKHATKIEHILRGVGYGVGIVGVGLVQFLKHVHFKDTVKFEEDDAVLTMSGRQAVNDALKDDQESKSFLQFWK